MKTRALLIRLAKQFPHSIAKKNHDFVGTMVGPVPSEVHKIVLCLDFDEEILATTLEIKPDIIFTHHPFFFGSKTKILKYDEHKAYLNEKLKENNIALVSFHTNFDEGKGGMNDALAGLLNLKDVYAPINEPMMRIGYLDNAMPVLEFAEYAKTKLNVDYALLVNYGNADIKKVAIIGGGGSRSYVVAKEENADIYISGDAPHHVRRAIVADKFNYLDVPHEVERAFMGAMKEIIKKIDPSLEVIILDHEKMPKVIL